MNKLTDVTKSSYIPTIYSTPCTIEYVQNEEHKKAHLFAERGGVIIVVYNTSRNVLVCVRQFRPALYIQRVPVDELKIDVDKHHPDTAITLEWCAGSIKKNTYLPVSFTHYSICNFFILTKHTKPQD